MARLPARASSSATPRPARWTRSTAPTTSSRRSSGRAASCPNGCRSSALDLGYTNVVPVDWVAGALEHIAHRARPRRPGLPPHRPAPAEGHRPHQRAGRRRARAALRGQRRQTRDRRAAEVAARAGRARCRPFKQVSDLALRELGIPREVLGHMELVPRFDTHEAAARARGLAAGDSRRRCSEYAPRLWDYWEREMEPRRAARAHAARGARRQARDDHRRLVGDRPLDRAEGRRRGRRAAAGRAQRRQPRGSPRRDRRRRRHRLRLRRRHLRHGVDRRPARARARRPPQRRHARQQRGPLDPPLDRAQLRPLPRLRTHDPAQLLRRDQADHRPAARTCASAARATSSTSPRSACRPTRRASPPTSPRRPRSTPSPASSPPR